jgi:hypothetical protein
MKTMRTIIATAFLAVMAGGISAMDFSERSGVSVTAVNVVAGASDGISYDSSIYSTKAKASAILQRILKDANERGIPVQNEPAVECQGKYYRFTIAFGPKMYVDKLESYVMTNVKESLLISAVEKAGGVYLETSYDVERGMSVYYVMPEGRQPEEINIGQ